MPWPTTSVAVGDVITASQLNLLPIQIADSTLGASAASFDFTSLPGQFAHLLIEAYLRGDAASQSANLYLRLNNDSAANYDYEQWSANAATTAAAETFAATQIQAGTIAANTAGANLFTEVRISIAHYAGAANNKTALIDVALKVGTTTTSMIRYSTAGFWRSNAAVNRVTLLPGTGNFVSGSRATIYGLA